MEVFDISKVMSSMKMMNRRGPRIEPWGTPALMNLVLEDLPFKWKFVRKPCRPRKKGVSNFCSYCVYDMPVTKQLVCTIKKITVFLDVNLSLPENYAFLTHFYKA